jgi:Protein of unknown function (DUF551)
MAYQMLNSGMFENPCVVSCFTVVSTRKHPQLCVWPCRMLPPSTVVVFPQSQRHNHRVDQFGPFSSRLKTVSLPNFWPVKSLKLRGVLFRFHDIDGTVIESVTHWMPLPAPPDAASSPTPGERFAEIVHIERVNASLFLVNTENSRQLEALIASAFDREARKILEE